MVLYYKIRHSNQVNQHFQQLHYEKLAFIYYDLINVFDFKYDFEIQFQWEKNK